MDRNMLKLNRLSFVIALSAGMLASSASFAQQSSAKQYGGQRQGQSRFVYNPVSGQSEARPAPQRQAAPVKQAVAVTGQAEALETVCYEQGGCAPEVSYGVEAGCGVESNFGMECGDVCGDVGCGNNVRYASGASFYAGFEATILKPRFEENTAFTTMVSDGSTFETFTDTSFSHDSGFAPRIFLGWRHQDGVGIRITWWHFDEEADSIAASPPANGFGEITHPSFGGVNISSTIPTDVFTVSSTLEAHTIDFEATKEKSFGGWELGVAGGLRYAEIEQSYLAQLTNTSDVLRGEIDYQHSIKGFGPTISLNASRPLTRQLDLFCKARGSVLIADSESRLSAGDDLDITSALTTNKVTDVDDVLSIGEIQIGLNWHGLKNRRTAGIPFLSIALESQVWNGAGSASSEDGSMGFFGLNSSVGFDW